MMYDSLGKITFPANTLRKIEIYGACLVLGCIVYPLSFGPEIGERMRYALQPLVW